MNIDSYHGASVSGPVSRPELRQKMRFFRFDDPFLYICLYYIVSIYSFLKIPLWGSLVLLCLFFAFLIKEPNIGKLIQKPVVFWFFLVYTVSVLGFYAIIGHGIWNSNTIVAYRLVRYVPDFIMGLYVVQRRGAVCVLIWVLLAVTAMTGVLSLFYSVGFYQETGEAVARIRHHELHRQGMDHNLATYELFNVRSVHDFAARSYYFLIGLGGLFIYGRFLKRSWLFIYIAMLIAALAGAVMTGYTIPIYLTVIGVLVYMLFRINKPSNAWLILVLFIAFALGVKFSYHFGITAFTKYFDKAVAILQVSGSGDIAEINRYQLFMTSFKSFIRNPVIGVGSYIQVPATARGLELIGGHSTLGDNLGQYGLLGNIGYFVLFGFIIKQLINIRRGKSPNYLGPFYTVFVIFFAVLLVHSFVNPTINTHSINRVSFLMFGLFFGMLYHPHPFACLMPPAFIRKNEALAAGEPAPVLRRRPINTGRRNAVRGRF